MQPMQHQMMGYDRAITMFSPDGRLLQVEYAKKTVRQGSTAIGMVCKDAVLIVADKRIVDKLIVAESIEKIFKIDDHIMATASGILSDARVLIDRAQVKAQQNTVSYDMPIDTITIVKDIAALKQICTQSGGLRPFGVSLLVAGVDNSGLKLYETDPTGIFFEYKAAVIGEGEPEIEETLNKEYRENISVDDGLKLAINAMSKVINLKSDDNRIDAAYINSKEKIMHRIKREKIAEVLSKSPKK